MLMIWRASKIFLRLAAIALVLNVLVVQQAVASWISWLGVGITVGGIAAAATPTGVGQCVGGVAGVVQVVAIGVDVVKTISGKDPFQPGFAASPEPGADLGGANALTNAMYQGISSCPVAPALQLATNQEIGDLNQLMTDFRGGNSNNLLPDLVTLGEGLGTVATLYDALNFPVALTQSDITAAQAGIGSSGLPAFEVSFLQNAGFSSTAIAALASYTATAPVNLAVPTVTLSQLIRTTEAEVVPEPSSFVLFGSGFGTLVALATACRFVEVKRRRGFAGLRSD